VAAEERWLEESSTQEPWHAGRPRAVLAAVASTAVLVVGVLAARIYADGYGADNDTWLMLGTWDALVDQHRYVPSRAPGYVVAEVAIGALGDVGGHWLSNAASLLLGAAALVCLHGLVRRRTATPASALLLVAIVGLTPAFVIAATTSIDYVYGLAFFLAGWWALERSLPTAVGGALLGVAGAARLSYAPLGLLVLLLGPGRDRTGPQRALAVGVVAVITVLAYVPPFRYDDGLDFLSADRPTGQGVVGIAGRALLKGGDVLGLLGTAAGLAVLVLAVRARRRAAGDGWVLAVVAVQLVVWVWLPAEPSYLLPALAALVVWIAGCRLDRALAWALVAVAAALVAYAVVDVRLVDIDHANRYGYDTCDPTEATGARWRPHVEAGPLLDYPAMSEQLRACNEQQRAGMPTRDAPP
jgi:hypothetical protein